MLAPNPVKNVTNEPITTAAMVNAGAGSETKTNYSFNYLVASKIFNFTAVRTGQVGARVHHYEFSDEFIAKIIKIHNGLGDDS